MGEVKKVAGVPRLGGGSVQVQPSSGLQLWSRAPVCSYPLFFPVIGLSLFWVKPWRNED